MSLPKVSVIIPNYNHADHLRQRIDSVLNQIYKTFEVIILDDCSTDESQSIINSYRSHPSITHIEFNTVNTGSPFKQWKKGIELTQGEWIWIAESDDYADERFLEIMIKATNGHKNTGLVYCDSNIVSNKMASQETFASLKNQRFSTNRWSENHVNSGIDEIENYLLFGGTINNTSAVLFKRDVLLHANPFDISLRYIGDKYAFVKVLAESDLVYVKDRLNYFRDPFNTKHVDRFLFYFYEQFLLFDWVSKNLKHINHQKFFEAFYANTRNSLFREWNRTKFGLYGKLFQLNRTLLLKSIGHNFWMAVASLFGRSQILNKKL